MFRQHHSHLFLPYNYNYSLHSLVVFIKQFEGVLRKVRISCNECQSCEEPGREATEKPAAQIARIFC